jgi:flagellar L-ring protein precursor FlgH
MMKIEKILPLCFAVGLLHSVFGMTAFAQSGSLGGSSALTKPNGSPAKMSEVSRLYQAAPRQKVYKEQDIIRVHVDQKWAYNNTANNQRKKSIKTKSKISAWFKMPDILSFPTKSEDPLPEIGAELDHKTQNQGNLLRRETLAFDISCRVISVKENGNLFIEGTEKRGIGEEGKILYISGIIRPEDIGPGNTIESSRISDLVNEEIPSGNVYDTVRRTWGARLIEHWKPL